MFNNNTNINSFAYAAPTATTGAIMSFGRPLKKRTVRADNIIRDVCQYFDVPEAAVRGKLRGKQEITLARQLCMTLIYKQTSLSCKSIGEIFNKRDHTTVIHAKAAIKDILDLEHSPEKDEINIFLQAYGYQI